MTVPASSLAAPTGSFPAGQGTIIDKAGYKVDASAWAWELNHPINHCALNFDLLGIKSVSLLESVARFFADLIKVGSADNIVNTFSTLGNLRRSQHFREVDAEGGILGERLISDLRLVPEFLEYRLHYVRAWYC